MTNIIALINEGEIDIASDYCDSHNQILNYTPSMNVIVSFTYEGYRTSIQLHHKSISGYSHGIAYSVPGKRGYYYCSESGYENDYRSHDYH